MPSRVLWRRAVTAAGIYSATLFGFLATVVAARTLDKGDFGVFALVFAITGFFQLLLDATVEEAAVKYGFRFVASEEWGRLRRLFRVALGVKWAGGIAAGLLLAALAPLAHLLFNADDLRAPLLIAAAIPVAQAPESVAAGALIVRGRYDLRGLFLTLSMALRLVAVAIGAQFGVAEIFVAIVVAQVLSTVAIGVAGRAALARFPAAPPERLAETGPELRRFVLKSAIGSGLVSARVNLGAVLLGVVSTTPQVADFRAAQAPQTGFASLSAPARLVLLTEQTRDVEAGRLDLAYRMLRRYMLGTVAAMAVIVPVAWWLMPEIVTGLFGADFRSAVDPARLILLAAAIQLVWGWSKTFPISIGRPGLRVGAQAFELGVFIPLLIVLAARWDATGAAAAVLASSASFALLWTVLLVRLRRQAGAAALSAPSEAIAR